MGIKNVIQDLQKKNFANSELVELEKKTSKLLNKVSKDGMYNDIDIIKKEIEFILLERKTIFSFTKELDRIDKPDSILNKIDEILSIIKKEGAKNKKDIVELLVELDHSYKFKETYKKEDYDRVLIIFDKIEENLNLESIKFNYNYIDLYEFNISGRQYVTFLNCVKNIAKNDIVEAIHSLREFSENYSTTITEPFWIYEKVLIKSMIDGIRTNIENLD